MANLILHHYPQSPVAEKVRMILGMKSLQWHSVEIPRIPPKPDLMPLTGGYRRTPVMQIGADIYCDSLCIIDELDKRYPDPSLFPENSYGLVHGLSRWTDGPMFTHAITIVLGAADKLPGEFAADRGRLYFGPDFDLAEVQKQVKHSVAQIREQFSWFDRHLSDGRTFMAGPKPGLIDALAYYLIWFIRGRWESGPEFLGQFDLLIHWEKRMLDIGHGHFTQLGSREALEIAKDAKPATVSEFEESGAGELAPGMRVDITPDVGGGDPVVTGEISVLTMNRVAITRIDDHVGELVIHFPRVGYRVTPSN